MVNFKFFKINSKNAKPIVLVFLWIILLVGFISKNFVNPEQQNETETLDTLIDIERNIFTHEPILPLQVPHNLDAQKIALGLKLFKDPLLSKDNTISCNSCHDLDNTGVDNRMVSIGINSMLGNRNSPTVFNSGFNFRQFWDGRAITLEEQIDGPIHNVNEMGSSWTEIITKLNNQPHYLPLFKNIYHQDVITPDMIRDAIATFERALVTTNSPFDRWLKGEENALTSKQKEGYQLFKSYGCVSCHQGINVGGNMFERIGVFQNFYQDFPDNDLGRFSLVRHEEAKHEFKVPALRNVAKTAPYLHNGSIKTLKEAISAMAFYQLGLTLPANEVEAIEDFLISLNGEKPAVLQ